ncbi:HIT family protein [Actinoplanes sp. GCM10030250]|uniref:HIT family protein n=1 Tax=Actinoplanes sp. GCM10030250 TaxID=3273376 RepID=UPI00360D8628
MAFAGTWTIRVAGDNCRWCDHCRPDETDFGIRVFSGQVSDTYFARRAFVRGYVVVVWRGRHVVEPMDLTVGEAGQFHHETMLVARALRDCFRPAKMNYLTMGNSEPHLHTHVTARYPGDPGDGGPLPATEPPLLDEIQWRRDAAAVRALL